MPISFHRMIVTTESVRWCDRLPPMRERNRHRLPRMSCLACGNDFELNVKLLLGGVAQQDGFFWSRVGGAMAAVAARVIDERAGQWARFSCLPQLIVRAQTAQSRPRGVLERRGPTAVLPAAQGGGQLGKSRGRAAELGSEVVRANATRPVGLDAMLR